VTSILVNVPLISKMAAEARFQRQLMLDLALVAAAGLAGVGLNHFL
jgi:hypothetical protein